MDSKRCLTWLLAAALGLPIVVLTAAGTSRLLGALGDAAGAGLLDRLTVLAVVGWILALIGLLICLAVRNVLPPEDEEIG